MFLLEVVAALKTYKVPYAVAGGYAVSLHGAVRGTMDIDLVISLKQKHLESAELSLQSLGLESRLPVTHLEISKFRKEYIEKRNLIAWGFIDAKDPTRMVDLLIIHDLRKFKVVSKVVDGQAIQVLSRESLIKMKTESGRDQDLEDVKALKRLS